MGKSLSFERARGAIQTHVLRPLARYRSVRQNGHRKSTIAATRVVTLFQDPPIVTDLTTHPTLTTPRLILRPWREQDFPAFADLNADPRVMQYMPKLLSHEESDSLAMRSCDQFDRHGFGRWAVEVPGIAPFAGFVGLSIPQFDAHFTPCVEIGWRLAFEHWGHGYATEAARAALQFGFEQLTFDEIVSFTVPENRRSRSVMERLGMTWSPADDFDHPSLPEGHSLSRHVLYRLRKADWLKGA